VISEGVRYPDSRLHWPAILQIPLGPTPVRIVSLCPSLTELVFALDRGEALVGRTKFCVQPRGAVERVEKVGGTKNPKIDRIVALEPDLVLMNEEENRREDADALRARGIACHTSMPRDVPEVMAVVRAIGTALGRTERGEAIARDIEQRRRAVRRAAVQAPPSRYAYLIWREPYMTVNADTYVSALLAEAGGVNAFADRADRYPAIMAKELRDVAPDVVLLPSEPFPFRDRHVRELVEATGLSRRRFRLVDGELLSWHGPRTGAGLAYAQRALRADDDVSEADASSA
jgi:ABC-type Fe3+-hydroxamate transport system substrate-binding protein